MSASEAKQLPLFVEPGSPIATTSETSAETAPTIFIEKRRNVYLDDGEGNWLMSYADMMTLLVGFFVMLTAFSKPDTERIEKLKQETAKQLGVEYKRPYEEIAEQLRKVLRDFKLEKEIQILQDESGLSIISQGTLFFDSASPALKDAARSLLTVIGKILAQSAKGYRIHVEGHSDDVPIVTAQFPSNWELSSARAGTVVRLFEELGLDHQLLRPVGFADTEPVAQNRDGNNVPIVENQAKNRRIVIRVQRPAMASSATASPDQLKAKLQEAKRP